MWFWMLYDVSSSNCVCCTFFVYLSQSLLKDFAYVDPDFASDFSFELRSRWQLVDYDGNSLWVTYNEDLEEPMLIEGWDEMRAVYQLQANHWIYFRYVGDSAFQITVFKGACSAMSMQKFVNRMSAAHPFMDFHLTVSAYQARASHLV